LVQEASRGIEKTGLAMSATPDSRSSDPNDESLEQPDAELLAAYQAGDDQAAATLFRRYYQRLRALAHGQLGWDVKGVEDSSDLAQSVFESVFLRCRSQQIVVGPDASLWPLLATITLNKARNRRKYHRRQKRDRRRDVPIDDCDPLQSGPSPADAMMLEEVIDNLINAFDSDRRQQIVRCLLEGQAIPEIAAQVGTSERTVYKTREAAMRILTDVLVKE
jgi:RNA polymerase sigma factor (sigma-70 family)